jgi:hypothetical protein
MPKHFGGWGLKDIWLFGKALAVKSLTIFLTIDSLWRQTLIDKYIALDTILDWIRKRQKCAHNVSNQWRAISLAFPIIGNFLAWKVGSREKVRIRVDAIPGCGANIFLPDNLVTHLHDIGRCTLNRISGDTRTTIWT